MTDKQRPRTRGRQYESDYIPNHGDVFSTLPSVTTDYTPALLQLAMEWDYDVCMYGLDAARAFQEMAQTTRYTRRQWIAIWTNSRSYRETLYRGGIPDHTAWLARMRHLISLYRLDVAAYLIDVIEGWHAELETFIRSPYMDRLTTAIRNAVAELAAFWRAIDPAICHHNPACFCRPAPFPAARDYRRRTKHRRRRQR